MTIYSALWMALSGCLIGLFFFGGLWLTVRKIATVRRPAILFALSFLGRVAVSMISIFYLTEGNLAKLAVLISGFLLARFVVGRYVRQPSVITKSADHHED